MPTYPTPAPIDLAIDLQVGAIEVVAGDRADTVVTVSPTNPAKAVDRRGAEETTRRLRRQRLTVIGPKPRFSCIGPSESVDVRVELPDRAPGSPPRSRSAGVRTVGRLGATRIKSLDRARRRSTTTGDLWLRAGHGSATVGTRRRRRRDHRRPRPDPDRHGHRRRAAQGVARQRHGRGGPAATSRPSCRTATSRSPGRSARSRRRPRTASIRLRRGLERLGGGRERLRRGQRSASRPASRPGSTCPPRTVASATSSTPTARPPQSEQTVAVRARTQFGDIAVRRAR